VTPDLDALGLRAVACKGWRWMPGMQGLRYSPGFADHLRVEICIASASHLDLAAEWGCIPNLSDPATLGCLLALVREARGESTGFLTPAKGGGWTYWTGLYQADYFHGDIEAEALVAALEAAP
jgi:hypothetical protein